MDSTCCQVSQPYWKTTQKIQQSETEGKNEVSDPVEHKVSITQDIPIERKNGEGLTCPGLSSTKPGVGSGSHHGPSRFPPWVNKKTIVTCGDLASRRGDDRGGGDRGGP